MSSRLYVREGGDGAFVGACDEDVLAHPAVQDALKAARATAYADIEKALLARADEAYAKAEKAEEEDRDGNAQYNNTKGSFFTRCARMVSALAPE